MRWFFLFSFFAQLLADTPLRIKFVSLGADCTIAHHLNHNELRAEAYPFDWIMTQNEDTFISLIDNNFIYLMDPRYLKPVGAFVQNTYYNLYFSHDWPPQEFEENLKEVQMKYARRIQRFNALDRYKGKVYFIRGAFNHGGIYQAIPKNELIYQIIQHDHLAIDYPRAKKIKAALDRKFPHLNFTLVIINVFEHGDLPEVMIDDENILEFRVRNSHAHEDYTKALNSLVQSG
jgi:hypothetical protein